MVSGLPFLKDMEVAKKEARSFSDRRRPNDLTYIGTEQGRTKNYIYYKDTEGNFWYESRLI